MTAVLRYVLRKFYLVCAIALIILAVLVQAGRSFSPMLNDYRYDLAEYLSGKLNARVSLGAVNAEWEGLKPVLEVRELNIVSHDDAPILKVARARLRLDLLRSLWNVQLVWGNVTLQQTALEFEQAENGFWRIPGLPDKAQTTPQAAQLDTLIDMLLLANKIEFQRTGLLFNFANGHHVALDSPSLLLENQEAFHRLSLAIDIDESKDAVLLVVEGRGDPRDQEHFHAQGFVALNEFPTSEPLAAATALLLGNVSSTQLRSEGALNAQLWFNTRADNEGIDIAGKLDLQTLVVPFFEQSYRLDSFSAAVKGHWLRDGKWQLALPGVSAGLQDTQIAKVNLSVSGAGAKVPLQIQLDQLQLSTWASVLKQSGILNQGRLGDIVSRLEPGGQLRNVLFTLPLDRRAEWQLEAQAEQLAVKALGGVPALSGVDGYIKAGQAGGFINLDSRNGFSMHFDPLYKDAMRYEKVSGQIAWHLQPEDNEIYVNSGAIKLHSAVEEATGYLWLNLPWQRNTGDIDLYLHIGALNLPATLYSKYLPARVSEPLANWLSRSIGDDNAGQVTQAGFVYRGTVNTPNRMARSHQLYLDIEAADLAYHVEWPILRNVSGRFLLNDNNIDASLTDGQVYDSKVLTGRIATRPNPDGEGALLMVNGEIAGGVEDGLRVLRESQLRQYLGSGADSWQLSGALVTALELTVPLAPGAPGASQKIDLALDVSAADIGDLGLSLHDVSGDISFHDKTGLTSENLQGKLFGEPVTASISSRREPDADAQTIIALDGTAPAESLARWSKRPELLFLEGILPYRAVVELTHRHRSTSSTTGERVAAGPLSDLLIARVEVRSDLTDVAINLPEPFGKPLDSERALTLDLEIREQTTALTVDYLDKQLLLTQARFLLQRHGNHLLKASVGLGEEANLAATPEFAVRGFLPALALAEWRVVQQRYNEFSQFLSNLSSAQSVGSQTAGNTSTTGLIAGVPLSVDIVIGSHKIGPLLLKDLQLNAGLQDETWHLGFANPMLAGILKLPVDRSLPMLIAIEELHLNRTLLGDKKSDVASDDLAAAVINENRSGFDPRDLPRANVTVDALYFDGINYGNWSLQVHPDHQGVLIDRIYGKVHGLTVTGIQPTNLQSGSAQSNSFSARNFSSGNPDSNASTLINQQGAQLYWLHNDEGARTRFIGSLTAGDMATVLRAWQKPDIVESTLASYQVDLSWPGAPGELALVNLQGNIDLFLEEGRFKRDAGAGDGILRLFALLNFDSIARRLRLDFSDLYKGGMTYDEVQGQVKFDDGKIYFVEPLQVASPSSRLQLAGSIDLRDETIDARLVAALPVAGNLTFLAAFATGLPAAVGIYLVSKIFRKQVDQATSVSYSITGSWEDPKMKFDRLFESEESLRSSVDQQADVKQQPGGEIGEQPALDGAAAVDP